jgi:hypothetical protein
MNSGITRSPIYLKLLAVLVVTVALAPVAALAEVDPNSQIKPSAKPLVGDFGLPEQMQVRVIDAGPVVHDYRSAPPAPVLRLTQEDIYKELWKSTCEFNPDIQFVVGKISTDAEEEAYANRWLADLAITGGQRYYQRYSNPHSDVSSDTQASDQLVKLRSAQEHACEQRFLALRSIVLMIKQKFDKAYKEYFSTDEQLSRSARDKLLKIAGNAAVVQMEKRIEHQLRNYSNNGIGKPQQNSLDDFLKGRTDRYDGYDAGINF